MKAVDHLNERSWAALEQEGPPGSHMPVKVSALRRASQARQLAHLGHATIDHEIGTVDEAALVAGQEQHRLGLLDGLSEASGGEMHFASMSLRLVISKPVLQEWGTVRVSGMLFSPARQGGVGSALTLAVPGRER